MAQVPFIDIARYARDAGFAGTPHAIIIALSVPESGRDPMAINDRNANGTIDRGLLQINSVHLGPGGLLAGFNESDLFDPALNLKAAYIIHKAQGFEAWAAYNKGLHGPSMDAAKAAMDGLRRLTAMDQLRAMAVAERDRIRRELEATKADLETAWSQVARIKEIVCA